MNKVERKDLVLGALYWYVVYQGESPAEWRTLVQVLELTPNCHLWNVYEDVVFESSGSYVHFESLHPRWLETNIKSIKAEQIQLARKLKVLESFV